MADAPAAAADAPAAPEAKAKSKKLPLIIAAVVVALGGAGAFFLMGDKPESAEAKGDADRKQQEPKAPALYVEFDPPFVVNFEAKGLMRFLQVSVQVMTRDQPTADLIKQHDPMLRNDLLLLLGNQSYETISTREGKESLRQEALKVVAKVIEGEGGDPKRVEQLYFTSFVMQ